MRRSHVRNYGERVLKAVGRLAYRCQECEWRGFIRRRGDTISYYEENHWAYQWVRNISAGLLILTISFGLYFLALSVLR